MSNKNKYKPKFNLKNLPTNDSDKPPITASGKFKFEDIGKVGAGGMEYVIGKEFSMKQTATRISFEDFEIKNTLGSGASACVKRIVSRKSQKSYAMKAVTVDKNEMGTKVIDAEVKALCDCACNNVIQMYDVFYREGKIYMIMEFMNCGSLEDVQKTTGKVPESVLSKMTKQILLGLKYLHQEKKIVHRDIKPANILVNSEGKVKLADFGMAGQKSNKNSVSMFETFLGTFTFMSPERIKGQPHSFDSDMWSVGLTLVQCALGKFPFSMKENTIWEMMRNIETTPVIDLLPKDQFSEDFIEFIGDCTKIDPKERPSPEELLNYKWITNHEQTKPSLRRWLHENFIMKKKEQRKKKEMEKAKAAKEDIPPW